jgi:acyl-CoA reductase-like NAD-dependent aldehyde dehydrogenase
LKIIAKPKGVIMSPSKVSNLDFKTFHNIVDGKKRTGKNVHHGINPATGEELWDCPIGSQQDIDDAVTAAKNAFPAWAATPVEKRKEMLGKFSELFAVHSEEFTTLLCRETGKPVL